MSRPAVLPWRVVVGRAVICVAVSVVTCGRAAAQGGGFPAVRVEPGRSAHWSLTVRQEEEPEKEGESDPEEGGDIAVDAEAGESKQAVVRSEYVVTGDTGRAVTKSDDGKRVEIYMFRHETDTLLFTWSESGKRVVPYLLDQYVGPEMRFSRRYPGIDWVRKKDYRGLVKYGGRDCHYFSMAPQRLSPAELAARADSLAYDPRQSDSAREAWFDAESGFPLAFKDGSQRGKFRHYEAPKKAVKLPGAYEVALRYYYGAGARPEARLTPPITAPDPPVEVEEEEEGAAQPDR